MELLIWAFLPEERAHACIDQSESSPLTHFIWDSLGKNVSTEVCFWFKGKITLFSFPKSQALRKQWMQFVFAVQQLGFTSVFVDEGFINKAQLDAGFAHRLILKDGAVPAIKDPGHDSELQKSETASNVCVLLAIGAQVLVTL